jgi:hypothetical protein
MFLPMCFFAARFDDSHFETKGNATTATAFDGLVLGPY